MPKTPHVTPFYLIVTDWDKKVFTIEGPMTDDNKWNDAVVLAQEAGRKVNCCTGGTAQEGPDAIAANWQREHGLKRVPRGSIVTPKPF